MTTPRTQALYERRGVLAIDPSALQAMYLTLGDDGGPPNDESSDAYTQVYIRGPLESERGWHWDSYDAIRERVAAACARPASTIVMRIASPGGDASGCFELSRMLRATAAASGKRLLAYVDDKACSAAYAIACAAERIYISETAIVGSIGVIATRVDYSAMNAAQGLRVAFITSGKRKADGHPDQPMTDAELAAQQRVIDSMAEVFFSIVRDARGIDPQPLEAGVFHGADALKAGLADESKPLDQLLTTLTLGGLIMEPDEEALAALKKAADGGSESAKRALAAWDKTDDADAADDTDDADASDETPPADDKEKDKAAAAATRIATQALAELHSLKAQMQQDKLATERATLISTRPDLSPELVATLASAPIAVVRDLVKTLPRIATGADSASALAAQGVRPTVGEDQGAGTASRLPPAEAKALRVRMGLEAATPEIHNSNYRLTLGQSPLAGAPVAGGGTANG